MDNKINILLIEDNPADAALIKESLLGSISENTNGFKFKLEYTDRLAAGIERLNKGDINIVLLDLSLPDSLGLNTLTKLHSKIPNIPIIVLTNHDDEIIAIDAVEEGAMDYILKSDATSKRLISSIQNAIKRQVNS